MRLLPVAAAVVAVVAGKRFRRANAGRPAGALPQTPGYFESKEGRRWSPFLYCCVFICFAAGALSGLALFCWDV
jgi:hypothetical protein